MLVPEDVLDAPELNVCLIDTRGIDEPSVPRRDLQAYLDDPRTIVVLCSRFEDAPSAAVQLVIERAKEGGLHEAILKRGLLLVLPKDGDECGVLGELTGEPVADAEEGREIRLEQVRTTTLTDLSVRDLPVDFLNVRRSEDCMRVRELIKEKILQIRENTVGQVRVLVDTVDQLIENKEDEQLRAVFEQATRPLRTWLTNNRNMCGMIHQVDNALLEEMDGLRYAASLRASVNRRGDWHNFDYWHGLGFGARREAVARSKDQITKLKGILENELNDADLVEAHNFLRHLESQVDEAFASFVVDVQQLGESAFREELRRDHGYWEDCRGRWGGGPGYKGDIREWTKRWFKDEVREARHQFIQTEVQRRWAQMVDGLAARLGSGEEKVSV